MRHSSRYTQNIRSSRRKVTNLGYPELNTSLREEFQEDMPRSGNFGGTSGGSTGGSTSGGASALAQNSCIPSIISPDRVEWNGDDCDTFSIDIPAADKVLHYKELLNIEVMNGIYYAHSEAVSKADVCSKVLSRERGWTMKTAMLANMFPMLTDSIGNTFYFMTQKSNLWKAISHTDLWGKDAVFIGFDRTRNEAWTRDSGYVERLCAMFFPHGDPLQQQYAPTVYNEERPGAGLFSGRIRRNNASVNWDEMIKTSREWTSKYAGDDIANKLKWHEESGDYAVVAHTFYDTMRAIERVSIAKKQKYPHSFVFLIAGEPQRALDIVLKLIAGVASTAVLMFTGVSIPPAAIEGLLQAIVAFAEGRGGIEQLLLNAIDVAVTLALGSGKDGKALFGEQTRAIIEEAYKVARVAITTKDPARIAAVLASGLVNLGNKGVLPNPLKDIRDSNGKPIPLLDAAMNFGFEQIRVKAGTDVEQTSQYLTNLVKSSTDFRLSMNQALSAIKKGGESVEKAFNAAVDRVGKIVEDGGTSILDDTLLRNSFLTALNGGTLATGATLGNVAAAVMNIPELRNANADTAEALQSFAGLAGGFGFNPRVFDQMQFAGLMKGAEEAMKKNLPFSLPSQLMSAFPDKADDYRIKLEKCFNIAITESTNRPTQVGVPDSLPNENQAPLPLSPPPTESTTDANGVVRNPQGQILGMMSPNGFQPIRAAGATQNVAPNGAQGSAQGGALAPNFGKSGWVKRGWQLPPFIRTIHGRTFACLDKVSVKEKTANGETKKTDARACIPFLGDTIHPEIRSAIADYCEKYLPNGKPRTSPYGGGLADGTSTALHPLGLQIACVAEGMLKENISEAALRQLYDNLPNERMTSRTAATFGDEGYVHFEKYSREMLPDGTTAPLPDGKRDYSAIFVWDVVEDAGRNCMNGWQIRNFIRNARILDAVGVPQSGMYTLNDTWKSLAEGGLREGAIFVRLMPNGTPHTGIVVKRDGDFFETIEANALANTGRGTDAAVQRFRLSNDSAVDWKFFHVWEDSRTGALRRPVGGRCCTVPDVEEIGALLGRPQPVQLPPQGTAGGWIPTETEEMRDVALRVARATTFAYHAPQVHKGAQAAVYWRTLRVSVSTTLLPKRVPEELDSVGYELNPDPFGEPLNNYVYKPEGLIKYAYRRRVYTAQDYQEDLKRRLQAKIEAAKSGKGMQQRRVQSRSRFGNRLRDGETLSDAPLDKQVSCVAQGIAQRLPNAQTLVSKYGGDSLLNAYKATDNTCAMFVWLFYQDLASCMGASSSSCRFPKSSRVFDQDATRANNDRNNLNKSLFHGAIAMGIQPTRTPEVGAIGCKPRQSEEAANASRNIPRDGIKGVGGHTFIVTAVTPQGFTTIESSNNAGEGNSSLIFTRNYSASDIQSRGIWFLPVQSCMMGATPPQNAPSFCCPPPPKPPEPQVVTNSVCAEAQPAPAPDCAGQWQRAAQGETRNPAFRYSPQGCWKCETTTPVQESQCNEPQPAPDAECSSIWIKRSQYHTVDANRFKYSGQCWYCERRTTVVRNPQCPPTVPAGFGTGWENVPAGASCNDTANYNYFKTSTGLCCFRKPKNPQTPPPPRVTTPPPNTFVPPEPPSYTPPPEMSGSCRACEENEDVWREYEQSYNDWNEKVIVPAFYHETDDIWFAEIGGVEYPVYGSTLEIEEVTAVTPPSLKRDMQNIQTMIARSETGEPGAAEGVKMLVNQLDKKVDALALQFAALDTGILNTLVQDVAAIKQSATVAKTFSPTDTKAVEGIVNSVVGKLQNFGSTALEAKVNALGTGMQQALETMQALPKIIAETTSTPQSVSPAKAAAQATADTFSKTAPPLVAKAVTDATATAVANIPPTAPPEEAAKIVAKAAADAATGVAATYPSGSPEAKVALKAAETMKLAAPDIIQTSVTETQNRPQPLDTQAVMQSVAQDVAEMKKLIANNQASTCVGELVKKLNNAVVKLESAATEGSPEAVRLTKEVQTALAPVLVNIDTMRRELLEAQNTTAQATVQATAKVATEASTQAAMNNSTAQSLVEELKSLIAANANGTSAAQSQQMKLLQQLVSDVQARANAGANVQPVMPSLTELKTAIASASAQGATQAVEQAMQHLVANMQSVPVPTPALQQNYDAYNQQIAMLRGYLDTLQQRCAAAAAQRNEAAKKQAMLNYWNMLSMYNQQCNVCPSCSNAATYF